MTTNQQLSLFISSKMRELGEERLALQEALKTYKMSGWLWEKNAGARSEPIRSTYLKEVEACDIYIGLFWLDYGHYTIEEYEHARRLQKPCLIYEKHVYVDQRSPELTAFLGRLQQVPDGLTVFWFQNTVQLTEQVQHDVMRLLTTNFRDSRKQPTAAQQPPPGSIITTASQGSIAIDHNENSKVTQNNYSAPWSDNKNK